jgi:DNA-binding NarL/FixJ family response regulator
VDLDLVVEAVLLALEQRTVLPTPVARDLVFAPAEPATAELSVDERHWLRSLADGRTIAEIAEDAAYSRREMHRLLRGIYGRLGVENRSQALVSAARQGIVG